MEPGAASAAAPEVAPGIVTILGLALNTDQLIAATHATTGLAQTLVVVYGIWAMVNTSKARSADYDKRHQQAMDDQRKRHEEAMAGHRESMEALKALIRRTEPRAAGD